MKQMREEQQRRRLAETKRNREIAQLRKEQRRQEVRAGRCLCAAGSWAGWEQISVLLWLFGVLSVKPGALLHPWPHQGPCSPGRAGLKWSQGLLVWLGEML